MILNLITVRHCRKWGFTSYLRELIDAPDAVMAYLCKQYRVYDIPVGSEKTRGCVQEVILEILQHNQ